MIEFNGVSVPFIPATGINSIQSKKAIKSKNNAATPLVKY